MLAENTVRKKFLVIFILAAVTAAAAVMCLLAGSSDMSAGECFAALAGNGSASAVRIMRNIRLPRVIAAAAAGAGLSVSGLIMQTVLNNPLASPSTLGVSNAAVFGANVSIIIFGGGFLSSKNSVSLAGADAYSSGLMAFVFAFASVLLILGLCRIRSFSPDVVVLSGIALGSVWTAATTILQFYATDVGISAAVVWSFGDLGRATCRSDMIISAVTLMGIIFFMLMSWRYNALLSGGETASSMGVNTSALRFFSMLTASLITAVCVSFLGMIGFVGIICPHVTKKLLGQDHRFSLPASALCGSLLLLAADTFSRSVGDGAALPVGAITSVLGAPFFIAIILGGRRERRC